MAGRCNNKAKTMSMISFHPDPSSSEPESQEVRESLADLRQYEGVVKHTLPLIKTGMETLIKERSLKKPNGTTTTGSSNPNEGELKVMILMTYSFEVGELSDSPKSPCKVQVCGFPRISAEAKDSQWVRDRQAIEKAMLPGTQEIVLQDEQGAMYEGLTSNFFMVKDGNVYTAPPGTVLHGTIQKLVELVCTREGIPLIYEFPNVADANNWQGAFITSTSRLVLPIGTVQMSANESNTIQLPQSALVERIRSLVKAELKAQSEQIVSI